METFFLKADAKSANLVKGEIESNTPQISNSNNPARYLLIRNPSSRSGKGRKLWAQLEALLRDANMDFDLATTESAEHATELARGSKAEVVVAVGGDGTINRVLDGVMQSGRNGLRMGVLYTGTSPDFCRFHGIPIVPEAAVATLIRNRVRQVDVGQIKFNGTIAHFGCSVNIGLGPAVARCANRLRRYFGDGLGTGMAIASAVCKMKPLDLELTVDGVKIVVGQCNNLSVVLNPYLASGLKLDLDLKPDDGRMAIAAVHGHGRLGFLGTIPGFYSGHVVNRPDILLRICKSVAVEAMDSGEIEFDGDPRGHLPATIEVIHKGLALIS